MKHPAPRLEDWWRVPRVVWHLCKRPGDLPRYLRQSLPSHLTPLDLGAPWWSFGAVDAVESILRADMEVFEFGSGGSSIFLAERTRQVTCVEDAEVWANRVQERAAAHDLRNLDVLVRPFDFAKAERFEESSYLDSLGNKSYDLIVVDGQENSVQVRPICFWKAESHIKPGGLIVLDDSWRYPQVKAQNKARKWTEHKGVGCCRRGVTSTCLFYY